MYEEYDDHEHARRLLAPLAAEPTGPSTVDVRRAIAAARRRVRTRRLAGIGAVAAVTALAVAGVPTVLVAAWEPDSPPMASTAPATVTPSPSPTAFPVPTASPDPAPAPPARCELELPPVPPDTMTSYAFGADPTGRIVYGKFHQLLDGGSSALIQPVLWIDGELISVDAPGDDPNIHAVNSSGVAVGSSLVGEGEADRHVAWIYQDGAVTELAGEDVSAHAITENGVVFGTRGDGAMPIVWRSPDEPPEDLPSPGRGGLALSEIMPDGTVVGFHIGGQDRSFVWWPDGTVQDIPPPEFDGEPYGFRAHTLNGHLLIGEAWRPEPAEDGSNVWYAATYDLMTGVYMNLSQDAPIEPWAMNRHGWVAGDADGHAVLWTPDGGLVPLPDLGVNHEYTPNLPHWISDDGRTVTGVVEVNERQRAAIWRCD